MSGREKKLSLGTYPDMSLKDAYVRRNAARRDLAKGLDPAELKQKKKRIDRARDYYHYF